MLIISNVVDAAIEVMSHEPEGNAMGMEKEFEDATRTFLQLKKENEAASEFQSRAKKQLEHLKKAPVFSKGYIRFKFPDSMFMQAAFSPSETMEFIYSFLKGVCKDVIYFSI